MDPGERGWYRLIGRPLPPRAAGRRPPSADEANTSARAGRRVPALPVEVISRVVDHLELAVAADRESGPRLDTLPRPARAGGCGGCGGGGGDRGGLASYAAVSRQWQSLVESRTFRDVTVYSPICDVASSPHTPDALTPDRRRHVRSITTKIRHRKRRVSVLAGRMRFWAAVRAHLKEVFGMLATWRPDEASPAGLTIVLDNSLMAHENEPDLFVADDSLAALIRRFAAVPFVRGLRVVGGAQDPRTQALEFSAASMLALCSRLPNLETLECSINELEESELDARRNIRADFIDTLKQLPTSISSLTVRRSRADTKAQNSHKYQTNYLTKEGQEDALSAGLREISQGLVRFTMDEVIVGREMFWPLAESPKAPHWPNLSHVCVAFCAINPSGNLFFERDFSKSQGPQSSPREGPVNDLYMAAAKAAEQMPRLRTFTLQCWMPASGAVRESDVKEGIAPSPHQFVYQVVERTSARAKWTNFRPNKKVMARWNRTAREHSGADLEYELLTAWYFSGKQVDW